MNDKSTLLGYTDARLAAMFCEMVHQVESNALLVKSRGATEDKSRTAGELIAKLEATRPVGHFRSNHPAFVSARDPASMRVYHEKYSIPIFPSAPLEVIPKDNSRPIGKLLKNLPKIDAVTATMKLPAQCAGWAADMMKKGYRVSSRSEYFGRHSHVIKKNGVHLILRQGGSAVVKNNIENLSFEQAQILEDLKAVGALID
jgi:hypothetical protein